MAWLGEVLPEKDQAFATPFTPRCTKDLVEEKLFEKKRDLFTDLTLAFFDTTSIYFEGEGADIGQRGNSKDHRPISSRWWSGSCSIVTAHRYARSYGRATRPM